jgi:hypothetical protein
LLAAFTARSDDFCQARQVARRDAAALTIHSSEVSMPWRRADQPVLVGHALRQVAAGADNFAIQSHAVLPSTNS